MSVELDRALSLIANNFLKVEDTAESLGASFRALWRAQNLLASSYPAKNGVQKSESRSESAAILAGLPKSLAQIKKDMSMLMDSFHQSIEAMRWEIRRESSRARFSAKSKDLIKGLKEAAAVVTHVKANQLWHILEAAEEAHYEFGSALEWLMVADLHWRNITDESPGNSDVAMINCVAQTIQLSESADKRLRDVIKAIIDGGGIWPPSQPSAGS